MAVADKNETHDDHHDDHHDHGEFIAHHFDSPEQQFDSGKLGIWIFLVTEILFFGGLFTAYALYRVNHPLIFEQAHVFLDRNLGALNTIVLLFSSLTMALGVHAAQNADNKKCGFYVLITMVCAAIFLGVKAVEYSHKWDMGIFPRASFALDTSHHPEGISPYLIWLSVPPLLLLIGFVAASVITKLTDKPLLSKFMLGMAITVGGYFIGAISGKVYMDNFAPTEHAALISDAPVVLQALSVPMLDDEKDAHADESHDQDDHAHEGEHHAHEGEDHAHDSHGDDHHSGGHKSNKPEQPLDQDIGTFFSIYYCMTGLHAIHIIGGIMALGWLYWRCLCGHWRVDYFGPVDYVGLYWHLVDLIWIYLFPLLYLID
jgi:cytochrome c oxidase subunit 3